jgi:hypothetical protein
MRRSTTRRVLGLIAACGALLVPVSSEPGQVQTRCASAEMDDQQH